MKSHLALIFACVLSIAGLRAGNEVYRTWTSSDGRTLEATYRGIEAGHVFLQVRNGLVYRLPLEKLSPADQEAARTLKPEGLGIPADPYLAQAAFRIDQLVEAGLEKAGLQANPLASDEQFVRRVYLSPDGFPPGKKPWSSWRTPASPNGPR